MTYVIIAIVAVIVIGLLLKHWGLLGKVDATAKFKANQAIDGATSAIDKKKMQIQQLSDLLDKQADAVTDLDAQVGTTEDELNDAQKALDQRVKELQDQQTATPDDAKTIGYCAQQVAAAESLRNTKRDLLAGLKDQAQQAHSDYNDSLEVFTARQNELPKAQATATLTRALQVKATMNKTNEAFQRAAAQGDDADAELRTALHKAEADVKMHGESDEARKVRETQRGNANADILARYGKKPDAASAPAAAPATEQK